MLPTGIIKKTEVNPIQLVMYSKPKMGKTTILSLLDDCLIIDFEGGTRYVDAMKVEVNTFQEFKSLVLELRKKTATTGRYKYIALDTVTQLEEIAKVYALELYKATVIGKSFKGDDIISLPNGAGYHWFRMAFFKLIDLIKPNCEYLILSGHLKDKRINDDSETVEAANIDLTGKIKSLICSQSDAIGYLFRKGNQTILSFIHNEDVNCGARPVHLRNKEIVLGEYDPDTQTIKANWGEVYK